MQKRIIWKGLAVLTALAMVASSAAVLYSGSGAEGVGKKGDKGGGGKGVISLVAPSFLSVASASARGGGGEGSSAAPRAGATFLEEEAGISAYLNVGETIDLEKAKTAFRTIEYETDEYIIGSVPLPDYAETEDVHAYVHKDGWVVAYYLKEEPAAKILDWEDYGTDEKIKSTKLEDGLSVVCNAAGVPMRDLKYYDFWYPNAGKMMIVADAQWVEGTDTFDIKLPSDFVFYERSYSHYAYDSCGSTMYIDGKTISSIGGCDGCSVTRYGHLSPTHLSLETFHTVNLWHDQFCYGHHRYGEAFGAIVLIYREA